MGKVRAVLGRLAGQLRPPPRINRAGHHRDDTWTLNTVLAQLAEADARVLRGVQDQLRAGDIAGADKVLGDLASSNESKASDFEAIAKAWG